MRFLSIDLGLRKSGFAIFEGKELIYSEEWFNETDCDADEKIFFFYKKVKQLAKDFGRLDFIIYEKPHAQYHTLIKLGELIGTLRLVSCENKCKKEIEGFSTKSVKKSFTGYGNCEKQDMIDEANKRYKKFLKDQNKKEFLEDESDAIGLGCHYISVNEELFV